MASTGPREARQLLGNKHSLPMAAATTINKGCIVMMNAAGYAVPGQTALGLIAVGCALSNGYGKWENTVAAGFGGAGDMAVEYDEGKFGFKNSAGIDAIADDDRGKSCYVVDDDTVALTDGGGTRSPAGKVARVEDGIVYVDMSVNLSRSIALGAGEKVVSIHVVLSKLTNGAIAARFTPGYAGRIKKIQSFVIDPVTTAAKAATLTPAIATVATTGGALALTSANSTPLGAAVDGTAITAANEFTASQEITLVASGVTAFVEGQVEVLLTLA